MPAKDPNTYGLATYLIMIGLASWGAVVNYLQKIKSGKRFRWLELGIDLFCAPFVGLVAGTLCLSIGLPVLACLAVSGFAGHNGPRFLGRLFNRALAR